LARFKESTLIAQRKVKEQVVRDQLQSTALMQLWVHIIEAHSARFALAMLIPTAPERASCVRDAAKLWGQSP
jgi:hypothetical protein